VHHVLAAPFLFGRLNLLGIEFLHEPGDGLGRIVPVDGIDQVHVLHESGNQGVAGRAEGPDLPEDLGRPFPAVALLEVSDDIEGGVVLVVLEDPLELRGEHLRVEGLVHEVGLPNLVEVILELLQPGPEDPVHLADPLPRELGSPALGIRQLAPLRGYAPVEHIFAQVGRVDIVILCRLQDLVIHIGKVTFSLGPRIEHVLDGIPGVETVGDIAFPGELHPSEDRIAPVDEGIAPGVLLGNGVLFLELHQGPDILVFLCPESFTEPYHPVLLGFPAADVILELLIHPFDLGLVLQVVEKSLVEKRGLGLQVSGVRDQGAQCVGVQLDRRKAIPGIFRIGLWIERLPCHGELFQLVCDSVELEEPPLLDLLIEELLIQFFDAPVVRVDLDGSLDFLPGPDLLHLMESVQIPVDPSGQGLLHDGLFLCRGEPLDILLEVLVNVLPVLHGAVPDGKDIIRGDRELPPYDLVDPLLGDFRAFLQLPGKLMKEGVLCLGDRPRSSWVACKVVFHVPSEGCYPAQDVPPGDDMLWKVIDQVAYLMRERLGELHGIFCNACLDLDTAAAGRPEQACSIANGEPLENLGISAAQELTGELDDLGELHDCGNVLICAPAWPLGVFGSSDIGKGAYACLGP